MKYRAMIGICTTLDFTALGIYYPQYWKVLSQILKSPKRGIGKCLAYIKAILSKAKKFPRSTQKIQNYCTTKFGMFWSIYSAVLPCFFNKNGGKIRHKQEYIISMIVSSPLVMNQTFENNFEWPPNGGWRFQQVLEHLWWFLRWRLLVLVQCW